VVSEADPCGRNLGFLDRPIIIIIIVIMGNETYELNLK
jgi:hypothetical protein